MDTRSDINTHYILRALVDKANISDSDATLFLKEFISVVTENISCDRVLEINSLGVFSIKIYNEKDGRESYYLDFVPSAELSGAVNKPFANFEATPLNEGVELDGVLVVDSSVEEVCIEEESVLYSRINTPFETVDDLQPEPNVVAETGQSYESDTSFEELNEDSIEIEEEELTAPIIGVEPEIGDDLQLRVEDDLESDIQDDDKDRLVAEIDVQTDTVGKLKVAKQKRKSKSVLIAAVVSVVVILAASAFFLQKKANAESAIIGIIAGVDDDATDINISEVLDTIKDIASEEIDTIRVVDDAILVEMKPEPETIKKPEVVTLTMGKTLRLIALEKYGHREFWVYIYLENKSKIANPNNVPVGVKLTIPLKDKYSINASDPSSIRKAVAIGNEVMSKYR